MAVSMTGVTGETIAEVEFDRNFTSWWRIVVCGFLFISVVGIILIPFWWGLSYWYGAEFLRRVSARLTTNALEIRTGRVLPQGIHHSAEPHHRPAGCTTAR